MKKYVLKALFVHTTDTAHLIKRLENHSSQPTIVPVSLDELEASPQSVLEGVDHVVISGPLSAIKIVNRLAAEYGYSIGTIPTDEQRKLAQFYDIPKDVDAAIDLALDADPLEMDLVLCNDHLVFFKATVGDTPLLDAPADASKFGMVKAALGKIFNIDLVKCRFFTAGGGDRHRRQRMHDPAPSQRKHGGPVDRKRQ